MTRVSVTRRLAVLIDGENFSADLAGLLFSKIDSLGNSIVRRVYGGSSAMTNWRDQARQYGVALREGMPGKNAADMHLAIEAMDLLHRNRVEAFCLISSDSDFATLARRLREDGLLVYGFGGVKAAEGFRRECDSFIELTKPAGAGGDSGSAVLPKVDDRVLRAARELKGAPPVNLPSTVTSMARRQFEQALIAISDGRRRVPLTELGNHLTKAQRGPGQLKKRLADCEFVITGNGSRMQVEVPAALLEQAGRRPSAA